MNRVHSRIARSSLILPNIHDQRVALVVGNSNYEHLPQLNHPQQDARLVADALQQDGFNFVDNRLVSRDLDTDQFRSVLKQFAQMITASAATGSTVAVFYYSGHGMEWDHTSYLLPTSSDNPTHPTVHLAAQIIPLNDVVDIIGMAGARLSILILDACRDDPQITNGDIHMGLVGDEGYVSGKVLIAYSTARNRSAIDDGTYAEALAHAFREHAAPLFDVFNDTAQMVEQKTDNTQMPIASYPAIRPDFYFAQGPA